MLWELIRSANKYTQRVCAFRDIRKILTLTLPIKKQLSSALSSACDLKSHFCKQSGPRSDCSFRSSLIRVHTVCLYAKTGLKSLQEYSVDDIFRCRFSKHLRVKGRQLKMLYLPSEKGSTLKEKTLLSKGVYS